MNEPIKGILVCVKCKFPFLALDGYYKREVGPVCKKCGKRSGLKAKTENKDETRGVSV